MKSVFSEPSFEKLLIKMEDVIYTSTSTGEQGGSSGTTTGPDAP